MPLLDKLGGLFSGSVGDVVEKIGSVADKFITTGQEKEDFKLEIQKVIDARDKEIRESAVKEMELQLKDVADARAMNIQIQQTENGTWLSKNIAPMVDIFILSIWGFVTVYLIYQIMRAIFHRDTLPDLTSILGIYTGLSAMAMIVIQYHRGSSAGSKRNSDAIRNIAEKST